MRDQLTNKDGESYHHNQNTIKLQVRRARDGIIVTVTTSEDSDSDGIEESNPTNEWTTEPAKGHAEKKNLSRAHEIASRGSEIVSRLPRDAISW